MKTIWTATLLLTFASSVPEVNGQLIPRRAITRPSKKCKLPEANYQVDERSRSVQALSYRFVYLDSPLERLGLASAVRSSGKTEITTVTTEKEVSGGMSTSAVPPAVAALVSDAISIIDEARVLAQQQFVSTDQNAADLAAARDSIDQAQLKAKEKLMGSGIKSVDLVAALSAIDSASLLADERILGLATRLEGISEIIARVKAERLLVEETRLRTGKRFFLDAAQLSLNEGSDVPERTSETTRKTTQVTQQETGVADNPVQRDQKLFQWKARSLTIDHCEISNFAVQLNRDGSWKLGLRADQNRLIEGQQYNPSLFIKRNQFGIQLRCYGNMGFPGAASSRIVGQPILTELNVDKFWVENGQPYYLVASKREPGVAENFDSIDRVEIEFYYYK